MLIAWFWCLNGNTLFSWTHVHWQVALSQDVLAPKSRTTTRRRFPGGASVTSPKQRGVLNTITSQKEALSPREVATLRATFCALYLN